MANSIDQLEEPHAYGDYLADRFYLEKLKSHITRATVAFWRSRSSNTLRRQSQASPSPTMRRTLSGCWLATPQAITFGRTVGPPRPSPSRPVIRHLGLSLHPALERGQPLDGLFLDHVLYAIGAHVLERYGELGVKKRAASGGLAPWQQRRAMELMNESLGSDDLSLKTIAEECGISVAHFGRAFRQSLRTSPHRWLVERRIEKAMTMLSREQASLADIALTCGFADQSHFTRVFTKYIGTSPGQWRRDNASAPVLWRRNLD